MVAILPVAALDAGRLHWSQVPLWLVAGGYAALLAGIAVTAWAQAVNPFFEPGVRIQSERPQRVIDRGPDRAIRHPGNSAPLLPFLGHGPRPRRPGGLVPRLGGGGVLILPPGWGAPVVRR